MQTYAMDLAPRDRRGYLLGTWQATMNIGQLIGPLLVGGIAMKWGLPVAFGIVGTILVASGGFVMVFGRETHLVRKELVVD